jgi:hypothetical protein
MYMIHPKKPANIAKSSSSSRSEKIEGGGIGKGR